MHFCSTVRHMQSRSAPVPGRRDRKRAETQSRIEAAATSLVLRDGLDATTVDAISRVADVSQRTFFNYFESKYSAILGIVPPGRADEDVPDIVVAPDARSDELLAAVVGLVLRVMGTPDASSTAIHRDRLEIIRRHPELVSSQFAQLNARRTRMAAAVTTVLTTHAAFQDDVDTAASAEVVLALCASAARAALHEWADAADPEAIDTIEQRAVALVTSTLRRLT